MKQKLINFFWVSAGFMSVALGSLGIVIPLLPTTPFYLLAVFFFGKGSDRFYNWFTHTKLYKKHLDSFAQTRSMKLSTKVAILTPVTILLILYFVFMDILAMRIFIVSLLFCKYYYFIFKIKTEVVSCENP